MEEKTGFGVKNSLFLPSLVDKYFNSLGIENNETIYSYNDDYVRFFCTKKHERR